MKLNQFTDYGLRILMYLSRRPQTSPATITELAEQFDISRNHLVKVVQFLSNNHIIEAQRGRGGGLRLADAPNKYQLGQLVHLLEQEPGFIDCDKRSCILTGSCLLKGILDKAYNELIAYMNQYTLADLTKRPTSNFLDNLYKQLA